MENKIAMNLGMNEDSGTDIQNVESLWFGIDTQFILGMSTHRENN